MRKQGPSDSPSSILGPDGERLDLGFFSLDYQTDKPDNRTPKFRNPDVLRADARQVLVEVPARVRAANRLVSVELAVVLGQVRPQGPAGLEVSPSIWADLNLRQR